MDVLVCVNEAFSASTSSVGVLGSDFENQPKADFRFVRLGASEYELNRLEDRMLALSP